MDRCHDGRGGGEGGAERHREGGWGGEERGEEHETRLLWTIFTWSRHYLLFFLSTQYYWKCLMYGSVHLLSGVNKDYCLSWIPGENVVSRVVYDTAVGLWCYGNGVHGWREGG